MCLHTRLWINGNGTGFLFRFFFHSLARLNNIVDLHGSKTRKEEEEEKRELISWQPNQLINSEKSKWKAKQRAEKSLPVHNHTATCLHPLRFRWNAVSLCVLCTLLYRFIGGHAYSHSHCLCVQKILFKWRYRFLFTPFPFFAFHHHFCLICNSLKWLSLWRCAVFIVFAMVHDAMRVPSLSHAISVQPSESF